MKLIPAIDIRRGQCVRLFQGDFGKETVYEKSPMEVAKQYVIDGALHIHMVDLDGAKEGLGENWGDITQIAQEVPIEIQAGGGIRNSEHIAQLLEKGISKLVIGSMAITEVDVVKKWLNRFGSEKLVLALDVMMDIQNVPRLLTQGWQQKQKISLWELLEKYQNTTLKNVLCTDVSRDGAMTGPNVSLYQECMARFPQIAWQASGGISSLNDLLELNQLNLYGAVIGKALYEQKFTLPDAFKAIQT